MFQNVRYENQTVLTMFVFIDLNDEVMSSTSAYMTTLQSPM